MNGSTLPLRRCDDCPWDLCDQGQRCLRYEEQPVQRDDGLWDALDGNGYGHSLGFSTRAECEAWLQGYHTGSQENM